MIAQFRLLVSVLFLFGFAVSPSAENVRVNLEEPRDAALYSGISNLRGWAVAESGIAAIEIDIDGTYAFNVPMGGARGDVANAYPDYPDSDLSGFSMAFNYKGLESGEHVVTARAISNDGNIATRDATINVARFVSSYISDVEQIDTGTVSQVTTDGQSIALKDIAVEGQKWDITLSFDTATQGFALTEISSADEGGGNTACTSAWQSGDYTLERDGVTRSFRVHVPDNPGIAGPYPMVIVFHGWGGDEGEFLKRAPVTTEADARGYVVVAPLGLGGEEPGNHFASWSFSGSTTGLDGTPAAGEICDDALTQDYTYPSCSGVAQNDCSWTQCTDDDIAFAVELVETVSNNVCVDTDRVYAVGGSNGGMFVWDLARHESSGAAFSAIAALIGMPHRGYLGPPVLPRGMPAILITGMNDRTSPPGDWGDTAFTTTSDGDYFYYTGATAITEAWADAHRCDTTVPPDVFDVGVDDVECRAWSYCDAASAWPPVMDCRHEIGHRYGLSWSWPLILDFFEQQ